MLSQLDTVIGFVVVMSVVSLLIMVFTQMASSFLGLRGKNLADALEAMFHRLHPEIDPTVCQALVAEALTDPVISDSIFSMKKKGCFLLRVWPLTKLRRRWKLASAIRADELYDFLRAKAALATPAPDAAPDPKKAAPDAGPAAAVRIMASLGKGATAAAAAGTNPEMTQLEKWFNSAQDRAQQWFAMHARLATIAAALIAAFFLQLDTFELLQTLSSNPNVRAKLVAQTDALERQAEGVANQQVEPSVHKAAMDALRKRHSTLPSELDVLPDGRTLPQAEDWLEDKLQAHPDIPRLRAEYRREVQQAELAQSEKTFSRIEEDNAKTGLQLMPSPYPLTWNPAWSLSHWYAIVIPRADLAWSWPLRHLVGILMSAALLSLGGPFWFNLLSQLANLRTALADGIDKNPKQLPAPKTGT
jgi:hypothetical protein